MDNQNNGMTDGKLERLEKRIIELLGQSRDHYYTEYLQKMLAKVRIEQLQTDQLLSELDRSYQLYLQLNPTARGNFGNGTAKTEQAAFSGQGGQNLQPVDRQAAYQPARRQASFQPAGQQAVYQPARQHASFQSVSQQTSYQPAGSKQPSFTERQAVSQADSWQQNVQVPVRHQNTEFTVGVAVFSVIGAVFILAAFVMLGMNFMNGFVKGMSLYAIALALLLVSELLLYKKNPQIGRAITAIGVGGLYLSTILNYLSLHNFNGLTAMILTAVITAATLFLSHKRDSDLLRVIGMIACYLCFLPIAGGNSGLEFLVMSVILFLMNLMIGLLPVHKAGISLSVAHMISNTLFSQLFLWRASWNSVGQGYQAVFLLSSFVILNFIFMRMQEMGDKERAAGKQFDRTGVIVSFCICAALYLGMFCFINVSHADVPFWLKHVCTGAAAVICLVFFILERKRQEKWVLYYLVQVMAGIFYVLSLNDWEVVISLLVLLAASKLLARNKTLAVSEAIVTAVSCLAALIYYDRPFVHALGAALVLSVFFLQRWQTYYEILLTVTFAGLALLMLPNLIRLPAAVGILFMSILLFHNIKKYKGRQIIIFNYTVLALQAVCFLMLSQRIYNRAYLTYLMMLVFGLATIVLTFREKYEMDFKGKYLILSLFLTYMAFVCRTGIPIFTSILLMVIALISVGMGFALSDKSVRIYGLVLSMSVCCKVILYDFIDAAAVQRMILFFVVGAIALTISGIYIVLEKKYRDKEHNSLLGRM